MQLKNKSILASGLILLSAGLLIGRFTRFVFAGVQISEFLEGFFVGISIVVNLAYMIRFRTAKIGTSAKI